jgi:hypothetical protein
LLVTAACASALPPEPKLDSRRLLDALEKSRAEEAAEYAARFDQTSCDRIDASLREVTELANPGVHLAYAKRVARCESPSAAFIVFRVMPARLLARWDPAELTREYAFLRADRARSLALFKTTLNDTSEIFDVDPKDESRPLREGFAPERALESTCADFADVTPKYPAQFQSALDVLRRAHCDADARALVRRGLGGASRVRQASCSEAERAMPDLVAEMEEAARTDPGEPVYERTSTASGPSNGIVGAIVGALVDAALAPLHPTSLRVKYIDHPGRTICEPAAANLRARAK